jgi:hypothetical protein
MDVEVDGVDGGEVTESLGEAARLDEGFSHQPSDGSGGM